MLARGGGAPRAPLRGISEESGVLLVARHDVMPPPERQKIGEANTSIAPVQAGLQVGDLGSMFVILLFVLGIPEITAQVEDELLPPQVFFRIVDQFFEGRRGHLAGFGRVEIAQFVRRSHTRRPGIRPSRLRFFGSRCPLCCGSRAPAWPVPDRRHRVSRQPDSPARTSYGLGLEEQPVPPIFEN